MNQYTDIQVIECARLHSEEARSGNNEEKASWVNNLTDIVHLDPGDSVSVHGAMISERGAGQNQSIEIKGVNLGYKKTFKHVDVKYLNASGSLPSGFETIQCNASESEIYIRDDTLNFVLQYFQTMNAHNYIQLPRNWWYKENSTQVEQWTEDDDVLGGMSWTNILYELDRFSLKDDYYVSNTDPNPDKRTMKPKNDNSRYTIMMRDNSYYTEANASGNLGGFINSTPGTYNASLGRSRDPENSTYHIYRELKGLTLPAGFNSPEYVSTEITRQLQKIIKDEVREYEFYEPNPGLPDAINTPVPIYRTIETETYKPFNVANIFRYLDPKIATDFAKIRDGFLEYMNACGTLVGATNASGADYLSQYHLIATKRPEIYETGRLINFYERDSTPGGLPNASGINEPSGIFGAETMYNWANSSNDIVINQTYNEKNCKLWRDFFDAQAKYPEVWDMLDNPKNNYVKGDTINNSRWMHMNRQTNASQTYTDTEREAMLGDSYYRFHDSNINGSARYTNFHSVLLPLIYNGKDDDTFYENPTRNERSFGCIKKSPDGYIVLTATTNNGVGSPLYTDLLQGGDFQVNSGRKIGFDQHFNAPAMTYILPYAGYSQIPSSYNQSGAELPTGDYQIQVLDRWLPDRKIDAAQFVNKLYIGADAPKLNYNGTNFTFSDLHTPLNNGNDNRVNYIPAAHAAEATTEAGATVYKINPIEYLNDWTPARKPILAHDDSSALNPAMERWGIYDSSCGVFMTEFNLSQDEWTGSLWDLLGFTYKQFNSSNSRGKRVTNTNVNTLSMITTNADIGTADSKIYVQNQFGVPLYNTMMPITSNLEAGSVNVLPYYPPISQKTTSIEIIAENLPTRMIRGYYTIRSNILQSAPFIGGKLNNTRMPIIGVVNKINGYGDFYFGNESDLEFTVTKPLKLASITCAICDPDGSYAHCSEQSTVLFKIKKPKAVTFNVAQEILQEQQQGKK